MQFAWIAGYGKLGLKGGKMKKAYALLGLVLIGLIFIGCAKVKFAPTGKTYPPYEGTVKIFKSPPTDLKYEEIGWVTADGDFNHPWAELLQMMQKEAASRGANALILEEKFTTKMDSEVNIGGREEERSITAIAVRTLE
jgi:hypothetical protein